MLSSIQPSEAARRLRLCSGVAVRRKENGDEIKRE
jgi:hypothetical protein